MGPVRRRLTAAPLALLPSPLMAEVCDKVRPDWTAASGPQTLWGETAYILASPPALALFALLALALLVPRLWIALPVGLLALAFAALLYVSRSADIAALALSEGCLASATPSIAALTLAAILTIARAFHVRRR